MEISDEDIQVLMRITLLTPTNKKIKAVIPYLKKFCPRINLVENVATFVPLFHTLQLDASSQTQHQSANIDLQPIIAHPNHQHYLNVQTYSASVPEKAGSRYALHLEFAQMIVRLHEPNYMEVTFRSILLKANDQKSKQLRPFLKVTSSHGPTWSGKERAGNELMNYDQSTTIMYHSLLDTIILQLYSNTTKLCECRRFIFELISEGSRIFELEGDIIRKASIKISSRPSLPIVIID